MHAIVGAWPAELLRFRWSSLDKRIQTSRHERALTQAQYVLSSSIYALKSLSNFFYWFLFSFVKGLTFECSSRGGIVF